MTKEQAEQFLAAFNALLTISTKGEDTRTMAKVLDIMENLAKTVQLIQPTQQIMPVVLPDKKEEKDE